MEVLPDDPVTPIDRAVRQSVEDRSGQEAEGRLGVRDHDAGHRQLTLAEHRHRTEPLDRLHAEVVAVDTLPLDGDEQPTGLDGARVQGDGAHDRRRVTGVQPSGHR